jgi:hypothetical protein
MGFSSEPCRIYFPLSFKEHYIKNMSFKVHYIKDIWSCMTYVKYIEQSIQCIEECTRYIATLRQNSEIRVEV